MRSYIQGARESGGQWTKKHKLLRGNIREEGESCLNQLNKILTDY